MLLKILKCANIHVYIKQLINKIIIKRIIAIEYAKTAEMFTLKAQYLFFLKNSSKF